MSRKLCIWTYFSSFLIYIYYANLTFLLVSHFKFRDVCWIAWYTSTSFSSFGHIYILYSRSTLIYFSTWIHIQPKCFAIVSYVAKKLTAFLAVNPIYGHSDLPDSVCLTGDYPPYSYHIEKYFPTIHIIRPPILYLRAYILLRKNPHKRL